MRTPKVGEVWRYRGNGGISAKILAFESDFVFYLWKDKNQDTYKSGNCVSLSSFQFGYVPPRKEVWINYYPDRLTKFGGVYDCLYTARALVSKEENNKTIKYVEADDQNEED